MAIKISCTQCGYSNDLGRVFCMQCGMKLNLQRMASSDLADHREVRYGLLLWKIVGGLLTVVVIGAIALGFWPTKALLVRSDASGGQQVVIKTRAVKQAIMARRPVTVDFTEAELNVFLVGRAEARKLKALVVDIRPGEMTLSAWFAWRPDAVTNLTWLPKTMASIPVSLEMTATFNGGQMNVAGGRIGHLPLVGPMRGMTVDFFKGVFSDVVAERQLIDALSDVALDQDVAHVKFGK